MKIFMILVILTSLGAIFYRPTERRVPAPIIDGRTGHKHATVKYSSGFPILTDEELLANSQRWTGKAVILKRPRRIWAMKTWYQFRCPPDLGSECMPPQGPFNPKCEMLVVFDYGYGIYACISRAGLTRQLTDIYVSQKVWVAGVVKPVSYPQKGNVWLMDATMSGVKE